MRARDVALPAADEADLAALMRFRDLASFVEHLPGAESVAEALAVLGFWLR